MIDLDLQTGLYLLAAAVVGVILGWLIRSWSSSRSLNRVDDRWQQRFDLADDQIASLQSSLEAGNH